MFKINDLSTRFLSILTGNRIILLHTKPPISKVQNSVNVAEQI